MKIPKQAPTDIWAIIQASKDKFFINTVNSDYEEFTRRCEKGYWHWDFVRMTAKPSIDAEMAWAMVKIGRQQRYRKLDLIGANNVNLRFNVPDQVQKELMHIDQQLAGRLVADDESPLTPHQKESFIISALREEAIASSMLEGAATTRRDAKKLLKSGRRPRTRGEKMVVNNYRAIQFVRANKYTNLTPAFLLELQTILTEGTLDNEDEVGRFRTNDDDISIIDHRDNEVIHIPPNATELARRIEALCAFANADLPGGHFIHPVLRACILHFQLGFDHPFCDGNGRTARALFYWLMLKKGYWLFEYIPISRLIYKGPVKYARAFLYCETDEFDVTYFLMYKLGIIQRARHELYEYIKTKQQQVSQARKLFSADKRLNHRQQEVVLQAARNPDAIFTIADHQSRHAIAYGTARSDLLDLVAWKYLKQHVVGNRYDFHPTDKLATD